MFVLVKPAAVWTIEAREQIEQEQREMQLYDKEADQPESPVHRTNKTKRK
jgi:hypothetical protein